MLNQSYMSTLYTNGSTLYTYHGVFLEISMPRNGNSNICLGTISSLGTISMDESNMC